MEEVAPQYGEVLRCWLEGHGLQDLPVEELTLALTHRSYAFETGSTQDNERLEFLGDAVIAAVTAEYLFEIDPEASEGVMSKRRSRLVSRSVLGRRAIELGLGDIILLGRGERETGGARRRSTLGSALEAVTGIVYLRLGFESARRFIRTHILEPVAVQTVAEAAAWDYKTELQEWTQSRFREVPAYRRMGEEGPPHERMFHVQVEINGRAVAQGSGRRVKLAENEAAPRGARTHPGRADPILGSGFPVVFLRPIH